MENIKLNTMRNLIIFLLVANIVFSQSKTIVPKIGTIVFNKETIVTDNVSFKKSLQVLKPKLVNEYENNLIFEQLSNGKKIDSVKLKSSVKIFEIGFIPLLEMAFTLDTNSKIVHEYSKDNIYSRRYEDGNEFTVRYEPLSGKIYNEYNENEIMDFFNENILEIKEFKFERKTIKNYDCFKVVYNYFESDDSDYPLKILRYRREMWVTKKIKLPFLSIIKNQKILFDYFPIEIVEYINEIDGIKTTYTLESIDLK